MAETNYDIIGRKLEVLDPAKFNNLNDPPVLSEVSFIPEILCEIITFPCKSHFTKEIISVAIILKLYEPDVLNGWKKSISHNGMRELLSKHLSLYPRIISYYISKVRNYYLVYKKFHDEVDYIASEIGEKYKQKCIDI